MYNYGSQLQNYYPRPSYPVQTPLGGLYQMPSNPSSYPSNFSSSYVPSNYNSPQYIGGTPSSGFGMNNMMPPPNQYLPSVSIAAAARSTGVHESHMYLGQQLQQQIYPNNYNSSAGPCAPGSNGGQETPMLPPASTPFSQPMSMNQSSMPSSSASLGNASSCWPVPASMVPAEFTKTSAPSFLANKSNSAESTSQPSSSTSDSGLLVQDLKKLFLNGVDCDLTLKVTGKDFKVHRAILRARSQVFEAMLSHDMIEKNKGIIEIPDIDAQAMELLLTYVYTGEIDSLSKDNVFGVFYAADKYNIIFLKEECSQFIKESLSTSIICDAIKLALNHNDRDLLECYTEYFLNHISDILPTVEWMSFLKANPIVANKLFIKVIKKMNFNK